MASLILGNLGSALLGPIGGFLGSAIGSAIDNILFAPSADDIEGPRIEDKNTTAADPGVPIPIVWGADRLSGIIVHSTPLIETAHKSKVGGKGGPSQTQTTYTYHVDVDFMLSEGPILGVGRIWADGKLLRGTRYAMDLDTDENFEKLGGINYPDWYKNNSYHPSTVFWSYNPTYNTGITDTDTIYVFDKTDQAFYETGTPEAAPTEADPVHVTYHYDEARAQYLPTPDSHDYTGGKLEAAEEPEDQVAEDDFPTLNKNYPPLADGEEFNILPYGPEGTPSSNYAGTFVFDSGGGHQDVEGTIDLRLLMGEDIVGNAVPPEDILLEDYNEIGTLRTVSYVNVYDDRPYGTYPSTGLININLREASGVAQTTPGFSSSQGEIWSQDKNEGINPLVVELEQTLIYGLPLVNIDFLFSWLAKQATMHNSVSIEWFGAPDEPDYRDWPDYYNFYDAINDWSEIAVLAFWGVDGVAVYRGTEDQISDPTMELADSPVPAYINRAHIVFNRLELEDFGNRIPNLTFEVVQYDDARVSDVIQSLLTRAELDPSLYDISELPDTGVESHILGYSITKITNFRNALEPILEAFELDAAEIGNQLVFRTKRRAYDHIVPYGDLAAIESGDDPETPIKLTFRDVLEMPRKLSVRFKDPEREYQPNTAIFTRQVGLSVQESSMDLPIVSAPSFAKRFTRDKIRDLWIERETGAMNLSHKYVFISPTDLVLIDTTGYDNMSDFVLKITTVTRTADGVIELEGVVRETKLYVPAAGESDGTSMDNSWSPQTQTNILARTVWEVLDIPALREADDLSEMYWAATGTTNEWFGAGLYMALDTNSAHDVVDASYQPAVMGKLRNSSLIDPVESCEVIDTNSIVEILLTNPDDSLSSITEEQFLAGGNAFMLGDELMSFKTATNVGGGVWRLTTLLRGRRDTVDHVASHVFGERFLLIEESTLRPVKDLTPGTTYSFKGVSINDLPAGHSGVETTFTDERKRPFRPVGVTGADDGSSGIDITWMRQDRMNIYGWMNELSEAAVDYQIDFFADDTTTTAFRTETNITDETFNYSSANVASDGYTSGDEFYVEVSQVSAELGLGNTTRVKITCP